MEDLVSVIVPIYNTDLYLDKCINSIANQTYQNLDILLIDDGSTDASFSICKKWLKIDDRIRCFSKENEGQGPTRNFGIRHAKGKYYVCVDSDDWIDSCYVEKLYNAITAIDADMAECDFFRIDENSGLKTNNKCNQVMGRNFTKEERIMWGRDSVCKIITRKEFIEKNNIMQPNIYGEDGAVYALMVALANVVASVNEPLYFYLKKRPGSTSNTREKLFQYPEYLRYVIKIFKERNLFENYEEVLFHYLLRAASRGIVPLIHRMSSIEHMKLRDSYEEILTHNFNRFCKGRTFLLGSYNLTNIMTKSSCLEDPYYRFNFSSIISLMSYGKQVNNFPHHKNPYRDLMIERDFSGKLLDMLREESADYIVIDFIEERHDVIQYEGKYYTLSDALIESDFPVDKGRLIRRESKECEALWKDACLLFIDILKKYFEPRNIILIRNILAEKWGDINQYNVYDNIDEISKKNQIIMSYYDFFEKHIDGIQVVDLTHSALYITDVNFEYGSYPWHLNELINRDIAEKIMFY